MKAGAATHDCRRRSVTQSFGSGARSVPRSRPQRRATMPVMQMAFWVLLVADVFAACYWPTSVLGALIAKAKIVSAATVQIAVLVLSALLTASAVRRIARLLRSERKGAE
jgi:hypothetical protein